MQKSKKVTLFVLMAIFVLSLGLLSFTTAKYVLTVGNSGANIGDDADIPYALLNKFEVTSQEDLFTALDNGYPYIMLSDKVRDPLIVTQKVMNVKNSLVLDLNGKRLERVSSNALLNVPDGVTLTIIDSSTNATGGLYNPVGTVLHVAGGTLNVRGGKYESGPRTWEYYTASKDERLPATQLDEKVQYYTNGATQAVTRSMPIIKPTITKEGDTIKSVDGNIYFDVAYKGKDKYGNEGGQINADTYCYYVTSDNFTSGMTVGLDSSTADFSYTYYAKPKTYEYISNEKPSGNDGENYVQVMVYGFNKNIQKAMGRGNEESVSLETGVLDYNAPGNLEKIPWYAAVKMESGKLNVDCQDPSSVDAEGKSIYVNTDNYIELGTGKEDGKLLTGEEYKKNLEAYKYFGKGSFISYFGVETAACVQFTGGEMTVSTDGVFATVNPATINAINPDALSSEGRGVVIHNKGKGEGGELTISGGEFLTYNMSVVRLMQGHCTVNNSNFYRVQDTKYYKHKNVDEKGNVVVGHRFGTGTVYSAGGDIEVSGTNFLISSLKDVSDLDAAKITDYEGAYGIYSVRGNITVNNSEIIAIGDCCRGVYSNPYQYSERSMVEPSTEKEGHVELTSTKIRVFGQRTFGVYSKGGTVVFNGGDLSDKTNIGAFDSSLYVSGDKTMAVYANLFDDRLRATGGTVDDTTQDAVTMTNTLIVVNLLDANGQTIVNEIHNNKNGDFNVAVNSVDANLSFINSRIESLAYGITALNGSMSLSDCSIKTREAPAIIVKGDSTDDKSGTITAKGQIDIDCYIKKDYVDGEDTNSDGVIDIGGVPNLWSGFLGKDTKNYLKTHSAIDIQGGFLNVVKDGIETTVDHFNVTFDTDIVTPETKNRIGDGKGNDIPYVVTGKDADGKDNTVTVFNKTTGQMNAASAILPTPMSAIRVSGAQSQDALSIASSGIITAKRGAGILVRGGNVILGTQEVGDVQNITIQTLGDKYYSRKYDFMGKSDNWHYRDSQTGGDAMFVSGGNVTSYANSLKLEAAHGNGLFVTGASIAADENFRYRGKISLADNENAPTVTINAGTFIGNANTKMVSDTSDFYFTGPSSYYGVKVVCGGDVTIKGGSFSGYGGVCTMGAITETVVTAKLTITGDYNNASTRVVMSGKRDVACFYNGSEVTIDSTDNPDAKVSATGQYDYINKDVNGLPTDFGVSIPDGKFTAFVIESYKSSTASEKTRFSKVNITGGYYRALLGDNSGGKAFWCGNDKGRLTIDGGYYIGNKYNNSHGGAIQQSTALELCQLNSGYFLNYDGGPILTKTISFKLGENKNFYLLSTKTENGNTYFVKPTTNPTKCNYEKSTVYVG